MQDKVYSLRELMDKSTEFLGENVFKVIFVEGLEEDNRFNYIQLKVKNILTGKNGVGQGTSQLIQILDISDKILYSEVKAEHSFLEMINAAVSHELRNPLNSLIGQSSQMKEYFKSLRHLITEMADSPVKDKLTKINEGLERCSTKMASACKFIDFFVHDVLD